MWWLFLPTTVSVTPSDVIITQFFFQGIFPSFLGLVLLTIAVRNTGPTVSAAFLSAVPGVGTVLALLFIGEDPHLIGWLGLPILTIGILTATVWQRRRPG